jgi:anion-transporting  ArsA/GET3 family ATPase
MSAIRSSLHERRIVVCVGCGGVGKTTVSAALALEAARAGRRALVLTIDPARRLADALGVADLGNEPTPLPRERLEALGVPDSGSLHAAMLDMKRTFDELVERLAEGEEARQRILGNRIYQHVSDALAGSVEYSAMEKVYQLSQSQDYDLIVLDTPPSQHALDFLDAPQRLLEFLDSRVVHLLIHPALSAGRFGFRLFQRGADRVLRIIQQVSGMDFVSDLSEFLMAFEALSEGFRTRATEVRNALAGPEAAFVLIAGPERESVLQAGRFLDRLDRFQVHLVGLVANRVRTWPGGEVPQSVQATPADLETLAAALLRPGEPETRGHDAARAAVAAAEGYAGLVRRDVRALRELRRRVEAAGCDWRVVAEQGSDVHDLEALSHIGAAVVRPAMEHG